jgi:protein TonB
MRVVLAILCALMLHALFLLFGGLLLPEATEAHAATQEVELVGDDPEKKPDPPPEKPPDEPPAEKPPDAEAAIKELEQPVNDAAPALDASSLAAIGDALAGAAGGGDFATAVSFASGGRIGGTGTGTALSESTGQAFSLADIDQPPRSTFQAQPVYPKEMRGRRVEATVSVLFVVDATGKVVDPRIEKSSHPAFEKPALDAVRQWKFEPAVKGGRRVACKVRAPIRFPLENK